MTHDRRTTIVAARISLPKREPRPRGYDQPLYLLPFDHRHSYVTGMFHATNPLTAEQRAAVADSKRVIYDGFQQALRGDLPAAFAGILLENAVRHGRQGGEVRIELGREGDRVALRVVDDGPGIPEAERERVFDRFHRLPGRGGGSGLGLSIVARIVEIHGGSITLGNGPQGRGLEVAIRFPGTVASPGPVDPGSLPSRGLDPSPRGSGRRGAGEGPVRPRPDAPP